MCHLSPHALRDPSHTNCYRQQGHTWTSKEKDWVPAAVVLPMDPPFSDVPRSQADPAAMFRRLRQIWESSELSCSDLLEHSLIYNSMRAGTQPLRWVQLCAIGGNVAPAPDWKAALMLEFCKAAACSSSCSSRRHSFCTSQSALGNHLDEDIPHPIKSLPPTQEGCSSKELNESRCRCCVAERRSPRHNWLYTTCLTSIGSMI